MRFDYATFQKAHRRKRGGGRTYFNMSADPKACMVISFRQFEERLSGGLRSMGTCDTLFLFFLFFFSPVLSFVPIHRMGKQMGMGRGRMRDAQVIRWIDRIINHFPFTGRPPFDSLNGINNNQLKRKQKTNTKRTYYHSCSRISSWKRRPVARYTQHPQVRGSWEQKELKLNLVRN